MVGPVTLVLDNARYQRNLAGVRKWIVDANTFAAGAMRAAGWHQHRREWRRKRGGPTATPVRDRIGTTPADVDLLAAAGQPPPATRADGSDSARLTAVDEYLSHPAAVALWGDFGRHVLQQWVNVFAGHDAVRERAMLRFASELRTRLAGPRPDALTMLLAERVVLAWVFANWSDWQYAAAVGDGSIRANEFHLKRTALAGRNLLAACRTLAKDRRQSPDEVAATLGVSNLDEAPRQTVPD